MTLPEPPIGWSSDEITEFLDASRANEYATYVNLRPWFQRLVAVDAAYRKLIDNLYNSRDWFAAFFLLRAHSNFLAAVRLSTGGQVPETYVVLRSVLENGLYGLYLSKNPGSRETWLRRHDSDAHKRAVRREFKVGTLLGFLAAADRREGKVAGQLYDRTIDYGAHPNEFALMQTLQMNKGTDEVEFKVAYLDGDSDQFRLALKTTAQVGVCVLGVFRLVFKERFDLLRLTDELDKLRRGL